MTTVHEFKMLEKRLNMISRDMEDFLKPQIELLGMKFKTSEIKNYIECD